MGAMCFENVIGAAGETIAAVTARRMAAQARIIPSCYRNGQFRIEAPMRVRVLHALAHYRAKEHS